MDNETKHPAGRHANSHYVIARRENGGSELLRVYLEASGETALPVFSFEESARRYLRHGDLEPEWHLRELYNGELISLLLGLYADARWILPNPLPRPLAAQDALLNLLDRGRFVKFLLR